MECWCRFYYLSDKALKHVVEWLMNDTPKHIGCHCYVPNISLKHTLDVHCIFYGCRQHGPGRYVSYITKMDAQHTYKLLVSLWILTNNCMLVRWISDFWEPRVVYFRTAYAIQNPGKIVCASRCNSLRPFSSDDPKMAYHQLLFLTCIYHLYVDELYEYYLNLGLPWVI